MVFPVLEAGQRADDSLKSFGVNSVLPVADYQNDCRNCHERHPHAEGSRLIAVTEVNAVAWRGGFLTLEKQGAERAFPRSDLTEGQQIEERQGSLLMYLYHI